MCVCVCVRSTWSGKKTEADVSDRDCETKQKERMRKRVKEEDTRLQWQLQKIYELRLMLSLAALISGTRLNRGLAILRNGCWNKWKRIDGDERWETRRTNLKKLGSRRTFINVDFQALIEKVIEQRRQFLSTRNLGFTIRCNQIQCLKEIRGIVSVRSDRRKRSPLTLSGLSLRYGGSPSIISIAMMPKLPETTPRRCFRSVHLTDLVDLTNIHFGSILFSCDNFGRHPKSMISDIRSMPLGNKVAIYQ